MPDNPARWDDLKATEFEPPAKLSRGSHPSLPYERLPSFIADLRGRDAIAARALEFLILTNVRTDSVLKARWDELYYKIAEADDLDIAPFRTLRPDDRPTARGRAFAKWFETQLED